MSMRPVCLNQFFLASIMTLYHAAAVHAGPIINTPTGLNPGDHFRIAFLTDGKSTAVSPDIAGYNAFVNAEAGGATFNGATVQWFAIASTITTSAFDNIQSTTSAPVYLNDGTQVATSLTTSPGGLWSGSLINPINQTLDGVSVSPYYAHVWSGTSENGDITSNPFGALGSPFASVTGWAALTTNEWINQTANTVDSAYHFYAISEQLTVSSVSSVPEPSTAALLGVALGGLIVSQARTRRLKKMSRV